MSDEQVERFWRFEIEWDADDPDPVYQPNRTELVAALRACAYAVEAGGDRSGSGPGDR